MKLRALGFQCALSLTLVEHPFCLVGQNESGNGTRITDMSRALHFLSGVWEKMPGKNGRECAEFLLAISHHS